jgi:hypothetical protein
MSARNFLRVCAVLGGLLMTASGCANPGGVRLDAGQDAGPRDDAGLVRDGGPDTGLDAAIPMGDAGGDAGSDAALDAGTDAGTDAGALDAGAPDAGHDAGPVDGGHDAGSDAGADAGRDAGAVTPPTVDGMISPAEWGAFAVGTNTTATIWAGNTLLALHAVAVGGTLYVGVEGMVEASGMNAMVVYVDGDPGGAHGVTSLSMLADHTGALDSSLSAAFTTPATFHADLAWGTKSMSRSLTTSDDTMGWRDLAGGSLTNFNWIVAPTATRSACTATACEASVPTASLGPSAGPRTITLFARITNGDGSMSPNQTLPMDVAAMPRTVSNLLTITELP